MRFTLVLSAAVSLGSALVIPEEKVLVSLAEEDHLAFDGYGKTGLVVDDTADPEDTQNEASDAESWWTMMILMIKSDQGSALDTGLDLLGIGAKTDKSVAITQDDDDNEDDDSDSHDEDEDDDENDEDDEEEDEDDEDERDPPDHPHPHPHPGPRRPCPRPELCQTDHTLWELLTESASTTRLADLLADDHQLIKLLNSSAANHTVFAPTDRALARLPRERDGPSRKVLSAMLRYHIMPGWMPIDEFKGHRTLPMALNESALGQNLAQRVLVTADWGEVVLNRGSRVVAADIAGTNGLIHRIDTPLIPPPSTHTLLDLDPAQFSTFALGLHRTKLDSHIDLPHRHGGTTFVPTNEAFRRLGPRTNAFLFSPQGEPCLRALLQYHLVPERTLYSDVLYTTHGRQENLVFEDKKGERHSSVHVELPTLLKGRALAVDVSRKKEGGGASVRMRVNGFERVVGLDVLARDGTLHVLDRVLIPPKNVKGAEQAEGEELNLEELKERLLGGVPGDGVDHGEL